MLVLEGGLEHAHNKLYTLLTQLCMHTNTFLNMSGDIICLILSMYELHECNFWPLNHWIVAVSNNGHRIMLPLCVLIDTAPERQRVTFSLRSYHTVCLCWEAWMS